MSLSTATAKTRMSAGRASYAAYIRSDAWRNCQARLVELERSGGRCRLCARGQPEVRIEVHHRTYANLGRERPEDLCTLCSDCHRMVTSELRRRHLRVLALPELRDTRRHLSPRAIADWGRSNA